jgi:hypothetical protein
MTISLFGLVVGGILWGIVLFGIFIIRIGFRKSNAEAEEYFRLRNKSIATHNFEKEIESPAKLKNTQ